MTIAFEELEGSPTIKVDEQITTATRVFRVAWDDWREFVLSLVGGYEAVGCNLLFQPPLAFPDLPNLAVSEVQVEPLDGGAPEGSDVATLVSGTNRYPDAGAKVTAVYRTLFDQENQLRPDLPAVPEGTYLTYRADLGAEELATPGRLWQWDDGSGETLPPDRKPRILVPTSSYQLVWHRVPRPPWEAIRALRGHINAYPFLGAPAGTVLFCGARVTRQFQFLETGGFWRVELNFDERTLPLAGGGVGGWNYEHDARASAWTPIKDAAGNPPYPAADFLALFLFGAC